MGVIIYFDITKASE